MKIDIYTDHAAPFPTCCYPREPPSTQLTFEFKQFRITGYLSPPSSTACHWSKEFQVTVGLASPSISAYSMQQVDVLAHILETLHAIIRWMGIGTSEYVFLYGAGWTWRLMVHSVRASVNLTHKCSIVTIFCAVSTQGLLLARLRLPTRF